MSTERLYHYVYRITNIVLNKHYYGKRTSKVEPKLDLGIRYFSSSHDKEFIKDQKINYNNYKYKIIKSFFDSFSALDYEIKLHLKFNVANSPSFYNKANQTASKFSTEGVKWTKDRCYMWSIKRKGINNPKAKLANIYEYGTNKILVENIVVSEWARDNNIKKSSIFATAKSDFTKPSTKTNPHHYKNMYIRYVGCS